MTHVKCVVTCDKDLDFANKGSKWKYLMNEAIMLEYEMILYITNICYTYKD